MASLSYKQTCNAQSSHVGKLRAVCAHMCAVVCVHMYGLGLVVYTCVLGYVLVCCWVCARVCWHVAEWAHMCAALLLGVCMCMLGACTHVSAGVCL